MTVQTRFYKGDRNQSGRKENFDCTPFGRGIPLGSMRKSALFTRKKSHDYRSLRPSLPIMASEANRERTHARALKALLSFPTPRTRGSFRALLLRDFLLLPQMVSLLAGHDYRRNDGSPSGGNFSSTLRFIINRRPTNLPNSSLDLVALSSYNFICLKQKNHMIFNSYLCHCPPSTHSYFFLYAAYALFFIRKIFKRTSNLAKKKKRTY